MNATDRFSAISRILSTYESATPSQLAQSRWYFAMNTFAEGLTVKYGITLKQAADIIAVFSPLTSVERNMMRAETFLQTGDAPGFKVAVRQAEQILAGETIEAVVKNGPKIISYSSNIFDPWNSTAITVDSHIYDWFANGADVPSLNNKGVYAEVADIFRTAAAIVGIRGHELQAVVWFVQKETKEYDHAAHVTLYRNSGKL